MPSVRGCDPRGTRRERRGCEPRGLARDAALVRLARLALLLGPGVAASRREKVSGGARTRVGETTRGMCRRVRGGGGGGAYLSVSGTIVASLISGQICLATRGATPTARAFLRDVSTRACVETNFSSARSSPVSPPSPLVAAWVGRRRDARGSCRHPPRPWRQGGNRESSASPSPSEPCFASSRRSWAPRLSSSSATTSPSGACSRTSTTA